MKNLKEISLEELEIINGGVAPRYDENGNLITCTDVPGMPTIGFPGIG